MNNRPYTAQKRIDTYLYPNYYRFALKKLRACEYLVKHINQFDDEIQEHRVCHELFYLMGYVVEGLSVYVIYNYVEWDKTKQISWYSKETERDYDLSYDSQNTLYNIKGHRFNHYLAIVRGQSEVMDIPFISGTDSNNPSYKLLEMWRPEIRYDYQSLNIKKEQIINLYEYCEKMFNEVNDKIGPA